MKLTAFFTILTFLLGTGFICFYFYLLLFQREVIDYLSEKQILGTTFGGPIFVFYLISILSLCYYNAYYTK